METCSVGVSPGTWWRGPAPSLQGRCYRLRTAMNEDSLNQNVVTRRREAERVVLAEAAALPWSVDRAMNWKFSSPPRRVCLGSAVARTPSPCVRVVSASQGSAPGSRSRRATWR